MSSPPTTLGQYQIIREIARSNDIVYEAYDPQMDRRVALKELNMPSGITDAQRDDRIQRFDREAKAAGRLAHPNIMRVFQVANDGVRHFMAMEYLDGHTLRNEIDTKGFLPVDEAVQVASAVLKGLGHAHANGVVHRDIKPDNIQLLSSGEIKITDFGIARLTFQPNLTMDGQVFGTPSYMSPEQVVGKEIDARSDLFSVGVLLYEMISGSKPFPGDSVVAITYSIMNHEPETLNQVNHSMWQVISRALDKSPALRYSSAQEMLDALEQASKQSIVLDTPAAPPMQTMYGSPGQYPSPPPVLTPYGSPYGAPPGQNAPPPIVYPFNPYATGMGGAPPPQLPQFTQQGYPPPQVYYPPPPRQPLLKPETTHFIGRLFLTFLVMGTGFAVMIVFIGAISTMLNRAQTQSQDQATMRQIDQELKGKDSARDKIDKLEQLIPHLRSPEYANPQKRNLAVLYEDKGKEEMASGDLITAEKDFERAHELDPNSPEFMSDLAALYLNQAKAQPKIEDRAPLYGESIKFWDMAAMTPGLNQAQHDKYIEEEGQTYLAEAHELSQAGRNQDAVDAIHNAYGVVPEQSVIHQQLATLEDQITRNSGSSGVTQ
jgi:serine/threonine-protein kinase